MGQSHGWILTQPSADPRAIQGEFRIVCTIQVDSGSKVFNFSNFDLYQTWGFVLQVSERLWMLDIGDVEPGTNMDHFEDNNTYSVMADRTEDVEEAKKDFPEEAAKATAGEEEQEEEEEGEEEKVTIDTGHASDQGQAQGEDVTSTGAGPNQGDQEGTTTTQKDAGRRDVDRHVEEPVSNVEAHHAVKARKSDPGDQGEQSMRIEGKNRVQHARPTARTGNSLRMPIAHSKILQAQQSGGDQQNQSSRGPGETTKVASDRDRTNLGVKIAGGTTNGNESHRNHVNQASVRKVQGRTNGKQSGRDHVDPGVIKISGTKDKQSGRHHGNTSVTIAGGNINGKRPDRVNLKPKISKIERKATEAVKYSVKTPSGGNSNRTGAKGFGTHRSGAGEAGGGAESPRPAGPTRGRVQRRWQTGLTERAADKHA